MTKEALIESLRKKPTPENILAAFDKVKREEFVPSHLIGYAYEDIALPVEEGSTLSQPSTVAFMLNLLEPKNDSKILEIGSGSGYVLALLSEIAPEGKIYGVEVLKSLAVISKSRLAEKKNVEIIHRDGSKGLPEFAPYDRILISASCPETPKHLLEQLKDPGILVAAVKNSIIQIKKENTQTIEREFPGFAFVPLVSEAKD
jgi:protein-L-isoaspartate(D-aspartate) O-methyltransferase